MGLISYSSGNYLPVVPIVDTRDESKRSQGSEGGEKLSAISIQLSTKRLPSNVSTSSTENEILAKCA
jgi:hypothetical protein